MNDTDKPITEYSSAGGVGNGALISGQPSIPAGRIAYIETSGDNGPPSTAGITVRVTAVGEGGGGMPEPAPAYVSQAPRQIADYWIVDMSDGKTDLLIRPQADTDQTIAGALVMDAEDVFGKVLQVISNDDQQVTVNVQADASADLTGNGVIITNLTRQPIIFVVDSDDENRDQVSQNLGVGITQLYAIQGANSARIFPYDPTGAERIANYISLFDADARYVRREVDAAVEHAVDFGGEVAGDTWIDTGIEIKRDHIYTVSMIADFTASGDASPTPNAESYQTFTELRGNELSRTVVKVVGAVMSDGVKVETQGLFRPVQWVNASSGGNVQDGLMIFGRSNQSPATLVFAFVWHGAADRRPDSNKWTRAIVYERAD